MKTPNPRSWMWSEAMEVLARAERMHSQIFLLRYEETNRPSWEPPVDVLETEKEVIIFTSLPGVDPGTVTLAIEEGILVIAGVRSLPPELRTAIIHRMELPQGHFHRQIPIPPGRYDDVRRFSSNGCLIVTLHKQPAGAAR